MPTEERVIASKRKIGGGSTTSTPAPTMSNEADAKTTKKPSGKRGLVIVLVAVLALGAGAGGAWFLLGPDTDEPTSVEEVELGSVLAVETPLSINLAGGHYLRLGLSLQLTSTAGADGEMDTAQALDIAIDLFSGRTVGEVASPEGRAALKAELTTRLSEAYAGDVVGVYFTDYVTQ